MPKTQQLILFSEEDIQILQELINRTSSERVNDPVLTSLDIQFPMGVYAGKLQEELPAYNSDDNEVSSCLCDIYGIQKIGSDYEFLQVGTLTELVFNIYSTDYSQDDLVLISKDKFGRWLVIQ